MFKVLGGIGRSVPLYNGKARILVKAIRYRTQYFRPAYV